MLGLFFNTSQSSLKTIFKRSVSNSLQHLMICSPGASKGRAQQSSYQRKASLPAPLPCGVPARLRSKSKTTLFHLFVQLYIPVEFTVPSYTHLSLCSFTYNHSHLIVTQKCFPQGCWSGGLFSISAPDLHLPAEDPRQRELTTTASSSAPLLLTLQFLQSDHSPA